jgi:hypothetical protein
VNALQFSLVCLAGWLNRNQQLVIEYLQEEVKVLKEAGLDPAPERQKMTSWKEFLRSHFAVLAAEDFFSVEVSTAVGLVRYHVFFVIRLATREVQIAGIVPEPHGECMKQVAQPDRRAGRVSGGLPVFDP